jgi:hypothetical protein
MCDFDIIYTTQSWFLVEQEFCSITRDTTFKNGLTLIDLVNFDMVNVHWKSDDGERFRQFCCRCDIYKIFFWSLFDA